MMFAFTEITWNPYMQNEYNSHFVTGKKGEQGNPGIPGMILCLSFSLKYDSPHAWFEWEYTLCRYALEAFKNTKWRNLKL